MTREEFAKILAGITRGVGRPICKGGPVARRQSAEIYYTFLGDLPAYALEIAAHLAILTPPTGGYPKAFPAIGTLRKTAQDAMHYARARAIDSAKESLLATLQSLAATRAMRIDDGGDDTADLPSAFATIVAEAGGWQRVDEAFRTRQRGLAWLRHQTDIALGNDDGTATMVRLGWQLQHRDLPAATQALLNRAPAEAAKALPAPVRELMAMGMALPDAAEQRTAPPAAITDASAMPTPAPRRSSARFDRVGGSSTSSTADEES